MPANNKTITDKRFCENIKKNIDNLYQISKEDNWIWSYDMESDILYFCNKEKGYSEKSIGMPVNEDYLTIQIDQKGNIEGIIIEDFDKLFVPENLEYREFARNLIKKESILKKKQSIAEISSKGFCKMLATDLREKYILPIKNCCIPAY